MRFGIAPKGADAMKNMKSQMNTVEKNQALWWVLTHQGLSRCGDGGLNPTLQRSSAFHYSCFSWRDAGTE